MSEIYFIIYDDHKEFLYEGKLKGENRVSLPFFTPVDYECCDRTCCNEFTFQTFKEGRNEPGTNNTFTIQYETDDGPKREKIGLDREIVLRPKLSSCVCRCCVPLFCFIVPMFNTSINLKLKLFNKWEASLPIHKGESPVDHLLATTDGESSKYSSEELSAPPLEKMN